MNMINKGIPYFPTPANFFDEEVMELLEAKFGVLASYMVMRLLCKIYKESAIGEFSCFFQNVTFPSCATKAWLMSISSPALLVK